MFSLKKAFKVNLMFCRNSDANQSDHLSLSLSHVLRRLTRPQLQVHYVMRKHLESSIIENSCTKYFLTRLPGKANKYVPIYAFAQKSI